MNQIGQILIKKIFFFSKKELKTKHASTLLHEFKKKLCLKFMFVHLLDLFFVLRLRKGVKHSKMVNVFRLTCMSCCKLVIK